ncbi:MAG: NPCBM/NEW2 domain-containing protein, partial [Anaeroplasmataceae bacterium]|nr:NPCBM/NEW2 domain-containing protein [Anaeroplasmataceae bacterium]
MVKKKTSRLIVILASLFLYAIISLGGFGLKSINAFAEGDSDYDNEKILYLSDTSRIKHATGKAKDGKTDMSKAYNNKIYMKPSYTGNDIPGGAIQAKIENAWYSFENGIYTHGGAYVAFDISKFSDKYRYFSAYVGLLPAASKSDGSWIYVQTSEDGTDTSKWKTQEGDPNVETVGVKQRAGYNQNALHITLDVTGVKWIRLCADVNNSDKDGKVIKGSNAQDYVVWADAKLSTSLDEGEAVKSLDAFDAQIKSKMANVNLDKIKDDKNVDLFKNNKELELLVLQREFVSRVGQYALKKFRSESADNKAMLDDWLLKDLDSLREFMLGGTPHKGNYYNSLTVLSELYKYNRQDLTSAKKLNNKFMPERTFGELCRTMMFSVALTHDGAIGSYLQGSTETNKSVPLRRYAIFK